MMKTPQIHPLVSADVAIFSVEQDALQVLLVKRAREPEMGRWALPGAVLKPELDRDLQATAIRALRDKLSVDVGHLAQVETYSGKDRDPRGFSVAVLFYALLPRDQVNAIVKSKVEAVEWVPVKRLQRSLAFDHAVLLDRAIVALREAVEGHALPLHLLPEKFTLTELQRICEAVLDKSLDKGVFRRRLRTSTDLVEVEGEFLLGAQRPAQLYRAVEGFAFP